MKQELSLYNLLQVLASYWKLLVILPLVFALGTALICIHFITPIYTASTLLLVTRPADFLVIEQRDIRTSRALADTYTEIIHSQVVLEKVIDSLNLPYSVEQLRSQSAANIKDLFLGQQSKVNVEVVRDTELIKINVTGSDPYLASEIANKVALVSVDIIYENMNIENCKIVDTAFVPDQPVRPRVAANTGIAFLAGLMLSFAIILAASLLDPGISDLTQVQELFDIPVIASIPMVKRKDIGELTEPHSILVEVFRTMRLNLQNKIGEESITSILITGANPQSGITTVATHLSVALARAGSRVLLVDADFYKPSIKENFGITEELGLSNVMNDSMLNLKDVIYNSGIHNLTVLPSGTVRQFSDDSFSSNYTAKLVNKLAKKYDYVIFDAPPVLVSTDTALLSKLVDSVIFVLDYGRVRKDEATSAVDMMRKARAKINGLVFNYVPHSKSYYQTFHKYGVREKSRGEIFKKPSIAYKKLASLFSNTERSSV